MSLPDEALLGILSMADYSSEWLIYTARTLRIKAVLRAHFQRPRPYLFFPVVTVVTLCHHTLPQLQIYRT